MKKAALLLSMGILLTFSSVAQPERRVLTTVGSTILCAKQIPEGMLFYVEDTISRKIDNLLVGPKVTDSTTCFSNDTLITCLAGDDFSPDLLIFTRVGGSWKYSNSIYLPIAFPLVGMLEDGKKHEKYRHKLVSLDLVQSDLTILQAMDQKLTPVEKYVVDYKVDLQLKTISARRH